MSKRTLEKLEENMNKRMKQMEDNYKQMEDNYKQMEDNNKSINDTFLSILTDKQIFKLFDECNYNMINNIISNKNGFDINMIIDGKTLLFHACDKNNLVVIQLLLSNTATDVNKATTDFGITPLLIACQHGYEGVVRLLLAHTAIKVNQAKTYEGMTSLMVAIIMNRNEVVRLLLAHAATKVNQARTDTTGSTPLCIACNMDREEMVRLLLSHSAIDVNQTNSHGETPMDIACDNNLIGIVELLLYDSRTIRTRPTDKEYAKVYDEALKNVKSIRRAKFRGLVRATIVFRRMRLRAALKIYAPGGAGFQAAAESFNSAIES